MIRILRGKPAKRGHYNAKKKIIERPNNWRKYRQSDKDVISKDNFLEDNGYNLEKKCWDFREKMTNFDGKFSEKMSKSGQIIVASNSTNGTSDITSYFGPES